MSNIENPICQFENCNRIATYRKLKVGNCHLKDTKYEFCGYHRPINSISKNFPYKTIFDKINIKIKYYNHQNENIVQEHNDHIHKLLKNHKFGFPIKITAYTENLVHDIMPNPFQPGQTLQGLRYCFIHHVDSVIAAAQLPTLRRNDVQVLILSMTL